MFTHGLSNLLILAVGLLVVFVLREYILKFTYSSVLNINYTRSEILVSCFVYIDQLLFKQIVDIFFSKDYYRESYILIIENCSEVIVAEWLDVSFESQSLA